MAIDGISRYAWGVPTKTYGQMCPLARSLDVLGERWTMLVIRELLLGPKRFKHLLAVLLDPGRRETFEFQVGDEVFHFQLRHGRLLPRSGPSPTDPTVRVACDLQTFMDLALRALTPSQALKDGRATILAGSRSSLAELFRVLAYTPQAPLPVHA
jgi:hypothetical protein